MIYVASSWRNPLQQGVLLALRAAGFEVYDFRNPAPNEHGFSWRETDPDGNWMDWTPEEFRTALGHPVSEKGFKFDMDALMACDQCVLVLPCGRSAHLELGYAVGAGKETFVLMLEQSEPELMYKMVDHICLNMHELLGALGVKD